MNNPNLKTFDSVVPDLFASLAQRAKAGLRRVADGVYEIEAQGFTARVRYGTGHRKDILVTLLPTSEKPLELSDLSREVGLGAVAKFCGENLPELSFDNEEEYLAYASALAASAEKFLLPYLLGLRTDFSAIKEFVSKNAREGDREVSEFKFPKNVRKEWL